MSRTRRRTTNRRAQDERHLSVRAVRRETPDAHKLSRAFINLALARAQAEADAQAAPKGSCNTDATHGSRADRHRPESQA